MVEDIHQFNERYEKAKQRLNNSETHPDASKKAINDFIRDRRLSDLAKSTVTTDLELLQRKGDWSPQNKERDLSEIAPNDVKDFLIHLEDQDYSQGYIRNYRKIFRTFLNWRDPEGELGDEIQVGASQKRKVKPEETLRPNEEVAELIEAAENPRDRALIAVTSDTSLRIGYIGSLRIKHVEIRDNHALLTVNPDSLSRKTAEEGTKRPTTWSTAYLQDYLQTHPRRTDPEAPLWISLKDQNENHKKGDGLDYPALRDILKRLADRADIDNAHWHAIRHGTIATWRLSQKRREIIRHRATWTGDGQWEVYDAFKEQEMNDEILKEKGLLNEKEPDEPETPENCPRCSARTPPEATTCPRCTLALTQDAQRELQQAEARVEENATPGDLQLGQLIARTLRKHENSEEIRKEIAKELLE